MGVTVEILHECDEPLPVLLESLGTSIRTIIAGRQAEILLPTLLREGLADRPVVGSPNFAAIKKEVDWVSFFGDDVHPFTRSPWGNVHHWDTTEISFGHCEVERFAIRFESREEDLQQDYEAVLEELPAWWSHFLAWVEILGGVDITTRSKSGPGVTIGRQLTWAWSHDDSAPRRLPSPPVMLFMDAGRTGVDPGVLEAAALKPVGVEPAVEWQLIREGRHRRSEGRWRASVLDAGTAAELAITRLIERRLAGTTPGVLEALSDGYRTLGNRGRLLRRLGGRLPDRFEIELVKVRNDATHEGSRLSADQAAKAEAVASDIVRDAIPLDGLASDA